MEYTDSDTTDSRSPWKNLKEPRKVNWIAENPWKD